MRLRLVSLACAVVLLFQMIPTVHSDNRQGHNSQLEKVLFGSVYYPQTQSQRDAIEALQCAAYLCPDQFNGHGSRELMCLHRYGVSNLPSNIEEIDFQENYTHRKYTHMGWCPQVHPEKGNWEKRKLILLSTVNTVFDFGWTSGFSVFGIVNLDYDEQCDALAALIYYVHILGDVGAIEDLAGYKKEGSYVYPLARRSASKDNPDILYDLIEVYLPNLFPNQIGSYYYDAMISDLNRIARKARSLVDTTGGINTEEKYALYREYTQDVLRTLEQYVPQLLMKEEFFSEKFK